MKHTAKLWKRRRVRKFLGPTGTAVRRPDGVIWTLTHGQMLTAEEARYPIVTGPILSQTDIIHRLAQAKLRPTPTDEEGPQEWQRQAHLWAQMD